MSSHGQVNISNLKNSNSPEFYRELERSYTNLTHSQEKLFFSVLISHFNEPSLRHEASQAIFTTIYNLLSHANVKVSMSTYICQLPFSNPVYSDGILDILYVLANKDPNIFTKDISTKFKLLIRDNTYKCLIILAVLANNMENFQDPWPMLDLLFSNKKIFIQNCPESYINLMVSLCKCDSAFLECRGSHCWSKICQILKSSTDEKTILTSYYGLCTLIDLNPQICDYSLISYDTIVSHFQQEAYQPAVISFFFRCSPQPNSSHIEIIINVLIALSVESIKPTYLLIHISKNESAAKLILKKPIWLTQQIPQQMDTTRLLLAIMRHESIRNELIDVPELITFFNNVSEVDDESNYSYSLLTIMKKLPINEQFVLTLCKNDLVNIFVDKTKQMTNIDNIYSMLLMFDTFTKIEYSNQMPDFSSICNLLSHLIKHTKAAVGAAKISGHFSLYKECCSVFKQNGVDKFLRKNTDAEIIKASKKLRRNLDDF